MILVHGKQECLGVRPVCDMGLPRFQQGSQVSCRSILRQSAVRSGNPPPPALYHCRANRSESRICTNQVIEADRCVFNSQSRRLYSSNSVSLSRSYLLMSLMASEVGFSCPNRLTSTTLSRAWAPCAMARLAGKETLSSAVSVAEYSNEGPVSAPAMTWCWSERAFGTSQVAEV